MSGTTQDRGAGLPLKGRAYDNALVVPIVKEHNFSGSQATAVSIPAGCSYAKVVSGHVSASTALVGAAIGVELGTTGDADAYMDWVIGAVGATDSADLSDDPDAVIENLIDVSDGLPLQLNYVGGTSGIAQVTLNIAFF